MKYKLLLIVALLFIYASSCEDDPIYEPFDYAAQALKDNDSLVKYMQEHFLNADGELEEITNDEPAIYDDDNLFEKIVAYHPEGRENVNYTLYYYIANEGVNEQPTRVDMVNVIYKGIHMDTHEAFDQDAWGNWWRLYDQVIPGWGYGVINFKSGDKTDLGDGTFEYNNTGKGILFIPSGLAYNSLGNSEISSNESLIFYIELNDVTRLDHDYDTIFSMFEDLDGDGDYINDDTDGDDIPNFVDSDDDGDGTLTKDENPDPNEDGNPSDAQDSDEDGIPDYLDTDNS